MSNHFESSAPQASDLFTQEQAARWLGISVKQLQIWRRTGKIGYMRFGHRTIRIPRGQIERLLGKAEREAKQ